MNADSALRIHKLYCASIELRKRAEQTDNFRLRCRRVDAAARLRLWAWGRLLNELTAPELYDLSLKMNEKATEVQSVA